MTRKLHGSWQILISILSEKIICNFSLSRDCVPSCFLKGDGSHFPQPNDQEKDYKGYMIVVLYYLQLRHHV
ncbi:hypothetical protein P8452_44497 [Trifolium repens]|nr:hypothetical protein P8452_44497 [Trifolium repens]